jgi:hypothetical protein
VLVLCYAALVLNISATIGTFVLIDTLSDIAFKASKKEFLMGTTNMNQEEILQYWGAGRQWNWMRLHCEWQCFLSCYTITDIVLLIRDNHVLLWNLLSDRICALFCVVGGDKGRCNYFVGSCWTHLDPSVIFHHGSSYDRSCYQK